MSCLPMVNIGQEVPMWSNHHHIECNRQKTQEGHHSFTVKVVFYFEQGWRSPKCAQLVASYWWKNLYSEWKNPNPTE